MTDNPRKHQYSSADWEYEVDSAQRAGVTGQTLERRHGKATAPEPSGGEESDTNDDEGGFDSLGIPTGINE